MRLSRASGSADALETNATASATTAKNAHLFMLNAFLYEPATTVWAQPEATLKLA